MIFFQLEDLTPLSEFCLFTSICLNMVMPHQHAGEASPYLDI